MIGSASSKTALIAAYMLAQRDGIEVIGLTSPGNVEFVDETGAYASTFAHHVVDALPEAKAVYVDMSGDGEVRRAVHERYGDSLLHDCAVGASHWDQLGSGLGSRSRQPGRPLPPGLLRPHPDKEAG